MASLEDWQERELPAIFVRRERESGTWLVGCTGCWSAGRSSRWTTAIAAADIHVRHHAVAGS